MVIANVTVFRTIVRSQSRTHKRSYGYDPVNLLPVRRLGDRTRVAVRASEHVKYCKTETYQGQMIPSMFIVHVDMKLTHKQQAPDNSSALVNKTAASQTVIHRVDQSGFEMHRPAQR